MWLISVPAWGSHYIALAKRYALPSIAAALKYTALPHRLVIHTDSPETFENFLHGLNVEFRRPLEYAGYAKYYTAHQDTVASSRKGELVCLLPGDCVVSREFFSACEVRFSQGYKAIATLGSRTLPVIPPPIGGTAGALIDWSLEHIHPMSYENIWMLGRTIIPSIIYFADEAGIVLHSFNHGIVAFAHDGRDVSFQFTHDHDLPKRFAPEEVHVVTDRDELALAECSGMAKAFPVQDVPFNVRDVVDWSKHNGVDKPWNLHFFAQRFVLQGKDSGLSHAPVADILQQLEQRDETAADVKERELRNLRRKVADNMRRGANYTTDDLQNAVNQVLDDTLSDRR